MSRLSMRNLCEDSLDSGDVLGSPISHCHCRSGDVEIGTFDEFWLSGFRKVLGGLPGHTEVLEPRHFSV